VRRACALFALALFTFSPGASAEDARLRELIDALEAAEGALRTVRVRRVIQYRPELPAALRYWDGLMEQEIILKNIADRLAPCAFVNRYRLYGPKSRTEERGVWDGNVFRRFQWIKEDSQGQPSDFKVGWISHDFGGIMMDSPAEYLWWSMGTSLSSALVSWKVLAIREVGPAPRTVVIELQPNDETKTEYQVAPAMGYAMVYRATYARAAEGARDWARIEEVRCGDFREVRAGLWLPHQVEERFEADLLGKGVELLKSHTASLVWELDPELDATMFTLDFPSGTLVDDRITGKKYRVAHVTDQMIADQVAAAKRLAQEAGEEASGAGPARMLFAACVAVLIAAGLIIYRFKRRRRAR
jgi:hypothetical protein